MLLLFLIIWNDNVYKLGNKVAALLFGYLVNLSHNLKLSNKFYQIVVMVSKIFNVFDSNPFTSLFTLGFINFTV